MGRRPRITGNSLADYTLVAIIIALTALVLRLFQGDKPYSVSGRADIVDGDSLVIEGVRVRLVGIDAPEGPQMCQRGGEDWPCGRVSADKLAEVISDRTVRCEGDGYDKHDRLLGVCHSGQVVLNRWMVENGWAVSFGDYQSEQRSARRARLGVWDGVFQMPRDWRRRHQD